jgi:hypothetical protein
MKFYFHQVWKENGREYANRIDFKNVGEARSGHQSAASFFWSKPGYTDEAITDLIWEDDQRQAAIQQGTSKRWPVDVTAPPTVAPCPPEVKQQLAAMIRKSNV